MLATFRPTYSVISVLMECQVQQRERKNSYLFEDCSTSEDEQNDNSADEKTLRITKAERRKTRRFKRRESRGGVNIFAARKRVLLEASRTALQKANAKKVAQLGPGGCQACMTNPCSHTPVLDVEVNASEVSHAFNGEDATCRDLVTRRLSLYIVPVKLTSRTEHVINPARHIASGSCTEDEVERDDHHLVLTVHR